MSQEWTGSMWGRETTPGLCLMQQLLYQHSQLLPSVPLDVLEKTITTLRVLLSTPFFKAYPTGRKASGSHSFRVCITLLCVHTCVRV